MAQPSRLCHQQQGGTCKSSPVLPLPNSRHPAHHHTFGFFSHEFSLAGLNAIQSLLLGAAAQDHPGKQPKYLPSIHSISCTNTPTTLNWLNGSESHMFASENCVNSDSKVVRHGGGCSVQWWAGGVCFPFLRESCWVMGLKICPAACTVLLSLRDWSQNAQRCLHRLCHASHLAQISPQQ